jgi:CRISPR-associated protein Csy1
LLESLLLMDESVAITQRCLADNPDQRGLRGKLAWRLNSAGRSQEAVKEYAALHDLDNRRYYPLIASKLLLPAVYQDREQLVDARNGYQEGLSALETRLSGDSLSQSAQLSEFAWSNFYLAYQGQDDLLLQRRYGQLLHHLVFRWQDPLPAPPGRSRRRIAVVSSFLRDCTVGHYFASWIEALIDAGFEVVPVQLGRFDDWMTAKLERICGGLVRLREDLERQLETIRELRADIILYPELGMDANTFLLAAIRLAPLQLCGWGHPTTSGLPTVDYYISCADMEPEGAQAQYSEPLLLLPGIGTSYQPAKLPEDGDRSRFGLPDGVPLYLFPHASFKVHPDNDCMIADLLAADSRGMLVLCEGDTPCLSRLLFERLRGVLEAHGLDAKERIRRIRPLSRKNFLRLNRCCDLMVDCLHWSGGNTTLDALTAHLPVVTVPGPLMRGRQSAAMLSTLGCDELICSDSKGLVEVAVRLAGDTHERMSLSRRIEDNTSALFKRPEGLEQLVTFLQELI